MGMQGCILLLSGGNEMNSKAMTLSKIRRAGVQLLTQNLGAVGMVRFLQQSDKSWGDYTKEREQSLDKPSLSEIAIGIKNMKRPGKVS